MARTTGSNDKIRRKYVHSFARQFLQDNNVEVYVGDEQILKPVGKLYPIKLPNTRYQVGDVFIEEGEIRQIYKFEELRDIGFVILSREIRDSERWVANQKVIYLLKRKDETGEHLNKLPKNHYVKYDMQNQALQLWGERAGPLGYGPWISLRKKSREGQGAGKIGLKSLRKNAESHIKQRMMRWRGLEEEPELKKIPEAAFMITDANEIICFPNLPDMPSILINGMKGCQIGTDTVLMANGTFKPIKDICVGDIVLSPQEDGEVIPSKVLKTTSWFCDEMYKIKELNRQKRTLYTCSYNHQIPLNKHIIPRVKGKKRLDLTYNDIRHNTAGEYAAWSKGYKQKCTTLLSPKIYSFGNKNPVIDPYTLGYFLGDGSYSKGSLNFVMHREDRDIYDYLNNKEAIRTMIQEHVSRVFYSVNGKFCKQLDELGLKGKKSGNKFFPEEVLKADSEFRLKLLAGYIDSDGHFEKNKGSYDFVSKSEKLIRGLNKLVRSLGGRTGIIRQVTKTAQNGFSGKYWRMSAYFGELNIPVKCARKRNTGSKMYLSSNRVSIDAIPTKPAVVYGFTLDSASSWYITNDYVVTHNSGKCIVQDEESDFILDGKGRQVKIADRPSETYLMNEELKLEKVKIKEHMSRTVDEVIEIKTWYNRRILVTKEHPLLKADGWIEAQELKKGDFVATIGYCNLKQTKKLNKYLVKLIAYFLGAGRIKKNDLRFTAKYYDYDMFNDLKISLMMFDSNLQMRRRKIVSSKKENSLIELFKQINMFDKEFNEIRIPDCIMELAEECLDDFISVLFALSGYGNTKQIFIYVKNEMFAKQFQHLLLKKKILSKISSTLRKSKKRREWMIIVNSFESLSRLQEIINISPKYKKQGLYKNKLRYTYGRRYNSSDIIPKEMWQMHPPKDWRDIEKVLGYRLKTKEKQGRNMTRVNIKKIADQTKDPIYKKYAESDILWDKITEINYKKGKFKVWDIEVDHSAHNFIANDFIVHNSYSLHSLVSRFFWKPEYGYKMVIMNDSSRETGTWCLPNNDEEQIKILRRLNEKPLPLPCVYLHPLVKEEYEKLYMGDVGFDVTIPFDKIIEDHKTYLNLKESSRYLTKMKEELLKCKTQEQAETVLEGMSIHHNVPVQSANKIKAEFDTLFESKLTDISTSGQVPWRTSKSTEAMYNPITAAVHAGLLPVLESEFISNYRSMLSIYFSYFVGDLFNRQKQDPEFTKENSELMFVVDEVHNISQKGIKSGADALLRRCVREGRPRRIGTLLATQKFNELPDVIKDNTTYLICFKNPGEAAAIANQYNMGKQMATQIKDLGKHRCLAYTTDHFIIYDSNGKRRRSELNEVFVGKTLPPYSLHKRPKTKN